MRLLVTRPMADAIPLAEALAAQGHDVVLSPLFDIAPTAQNLPPITELAALALTSANGVRALVASLSSQHVEPQDLTAWQNLPAYAVGPQTAQALKAYGWKTIFEADGNVTALADLLARNAAPTLSPSKAGENSTPYILHIAGTHLAGDLAGQLAAQNLAYQKAVLYQAIAADAFSPSARMGLCDDQEPIDAVVLYSQRSAQLFCALFDQLEGAIKPRAYCLSANIGTLMQAAGYQVVVAARADAAAMLALTAAGSTA